MDEKIQTRIRAIRAQADTEDLAELERLIERAGMSQTERANIHCNVRFPEWMGRERIMFQDLLAAFRNNQEAMGLLLEQDKNPVNFLYSDLFRTGEDRPNFEQVRTVLLDEAFVTRLRHMEDDDFEDDEVLQPAPLLPNLTTIDATQTSLYLTERRMLLWELIFPYSGRERTIMLPKETRGCDLYIQQPWDFPLRGNISGWRIRVDKLHVGPVNDEQVLTLSRTVSCNGLSINISQLTEMGRRALRKFGDPKEVYIDYATNMTDADITTLLNSSNIERLGISRGPKITGIGFSSPSKIKKLYITQGVTDEGLKMIVANCPYLEKLTLEYCSVTAKGLSHLLTQKLKALCISAIDDKAIKIISKIGSLEKLNLFNSSITDEDLTELTKLKNLRSIDLEDCKGMTREGLEKFMKEVPDCEIYRLKND